MIGSQELIDAQVGGLSRSRTIRERSVMRRANIFVYDECIKQDISFPELPVFLSEHYGQCAEDLIVASLLLAWSKRSGLAVSGLRYLEIGGNHPIATSATYLLNRSFGMHGVIVEANPALIDRLRKIRPDDIIVHGAVQTEPVRSVAFSISNQSELSSVDRAFVLAWRNGDVGERALITVPALRINEVIEEQFGGATPAYLSIDVEGIDLQVLRDLDFSRFRPVIIQIEPSDQYIPENSSRMKQFMATQEYVLIAQTEVNLIFMSIESVDLQKGTPRNVGTAQHKAETIVLNSGTRQLEAARAESSLLQKLLTETTSELHAKEAVLRQVLESRSWRITAPLRAFKSALKAKSKTTSQAQTRFSGAAPRLTEKTRVAACSGVPKAVQQLNTRTATASHALPSAAVSVCQDLCSLDEFMQFAKANPMYFDDAVEQLILTHCRTYGIQSTAMGICAPSEVAVTGPESREHLMVRGLSSRHRAVLEELHTFVRSRNLSVKDARIYGHEAITPLALLLRGKFPKYLGTEFTPGEDEKRKLFPIPHADVCHSEFADASFHAIISCDVLEHVQDIDKALGESARILVKGGRFIGTFPFLYRQNESVKLAVIENGRIKHLVDSPIYHGNPMNEAGGSLVFEIPAWDLIHRARRAGFSHAAMRFICDQEKGIVATSVGETLPAKGIFVGIFDK